MQDKIPGEMHAIVVADDKSRSLRWSKVPCPKPRSGEVLIQVAATAVNRADLLQRIGRYPPPKGVTDVMGLEAAGTIVALGEDVSGWKLGQAVCCLLAGGGYAEFVTCPVQQMLEVPEGMPMTDAASLPEAMFTAFLNLYLEGELAAGETALVHAGASGVGSAALQMCKALGNPVFSTATGRKLDTLRGLGADVVIDREAQDFVEVVSDERNGRGVDVILDPVGGSYLERNIKALSDGGRLVVIGLLGGIEGTLPLGLVLRRRIRVIGSVLRARPVSEKEVIRDQIRIRVWPHVRSGAIRPVVHCVLPIAEASEGHGLLRENQTIGKVVLKVGRGAVPIGRIERG